LRRKYNGRVAGGGGGQGCAPGAVRFDGALRRSGWIRWDDLTRVPGGAEDEAELPAMKAFLDNIPRSKEYEIGSVEDVLTPALVIYPELVRSKIRQTIAVLNGEASRWRPHVKTAKLAWTLRELRASGVAQVKCATTLELRVACESGAEDALVAYPAVGANARRIAEIAESFPQVRISALAEVRDQVQQWRGTRVGVFVDLNPGMDRTGAAVDFDRAFELVEEARQCAVEFRGLHYYDGHLGGMELDERTRVARQGYGQLVELAERLERAGQAVGEVITAGTPALPCSVSYAGFRGAKFVHRVSPGTVVYNDATTLAQLPEEYGYRAAALVLTRVVSHPRADVITCDAGHKTVSADAGVPTCVVLGHAELTPLAPSEEHLPMRVAAGARVPGIGETLLLVPRHVCPTVNNFDDALLVERGEIGEVVEVSARGRESPMRVREDAAMTRARRTSN
jgi:D-serine deaminase-like pyridoxal phosphate-dependent protein